LQAGSCRSIFERVDLSPIGLHVDNQPLAAVGFGQGLVELAEMRFTIVGVLPICIGVVHDRAEPGLATLRMTALKVVDQVA